MQTYRECKKAGTSSLVRRIAALGSSAAHPPLRVARHVQQLQTSHIYVYIWTVDVYIWTVDVSSGMLGEEDLAPAVGGGKARGG